MDFSLKDTFVQEYSIKKPDFGFNGLGELVYMRTYSRLIEENGVSRNEQWFETIRRVVEGTYSLQKSHIETLGLGWNEEQAQRSAQEMYSRMFDMKFLPPGRGLWTMGTDIVSKKGLAAALNNCAFVSTANIAKSEPFSKPFLFLMDMSMLGVGVGFDTEGAGNLVIQKPEEIFTEVKIEDTREGWVNSLKILLEAYCLGINPEFDYSSIRPPGVPLKTFGGLSSGSAPLVNLHSSIRIVMDKNVGSPITITTIVDIMNLIGKCVVAGNLRRCLPKGTLIHTQNGLVPIENVKPGTLVYTSSGLEPTNELVYQGYQDLIAVETSLGKFYCTEQHKMAVITDENNYKWVNACDLTKEDKLVFPVHVVKGSPTYVCINNEIVPLTSKCAYLMGTYYANKMCLNVKEFKHNITFKPGEIKFVDEYIYNENIPDFILSAESMIRSSFIAGIVDFACDKEKEILISSENYKFLKGIQCLYASLGLPYALTKYFNHYTLAPFEYNLLRFKLIPIPVYAVYSTFRNVETYDISVPSRKEFIAAEGLLVHNTAEISFGRHNSTEFIELKDYSKNPHRMEYGWTSNNSIYAELGMDYSDVAKRICINGEPGLAWLENMQKYSRMCDPPDNKDYRVMGGNPCLEQSLESYELCTLVETFPARATDMNDYLRTLKFAYLYAKTVTLGLTHWPDTNRVQLRNRRIGCSVSGIAQFLVKYNLYTLNKWLDTGYSVIQEWDKVYSEWLCIPRSVKTTSVKPSGTVSLLAGSTPGMHFPESRFYIRRMRLASNSPLVEPLQKAGYFLEPAVGSDGETLVVEIPVDVGEGIRTVNDVSMWEQVALAANMQRWWADNQVSCTVTFKPETEGNQLASLLDYYQYQLKGISFLPKCEYGAFPQMPYEEITETKFKEMCSTLNKISFYGADGIDSSGEIFCDSEYCVKIVTS